MRELSSAEISGLTAGAAANRNASAGFVYSAAATAFTLAYFLTFALITPSSLLNSLESAAANLLSLLPFALVVRVAILRAQHSSGRWRQVGMHTVLALFFSFGWYWLLAVILAIARHGSAMRFLVVPFPTSAEGWQILQGFAVYGALAALAAREADGRSAALVASEAPDADSSSGDGGCRRYFIRVGDEFQPIDVMRIVTIVGADDYSEVVTATGRHLVRLTLSEFEAQLGPNFMRVHRSRIVNMDRVERIEPAGGGRLLLLLENGESVQASRTGARMIRERII